MSDPIEQLFGRRVFTGSGRVGDYFAPAPDLEYLRTLERPEFIPDDHNYDPSLNAEQLIRNGMPEQDAMEIQRLRANLHQQSYRERIRQQALGAKCELSKIDPSRESFAGDLLKIFQQYPDADKDPDVARRINTIGQFARMMPYEKKDKMFDLSLIKDPEIRKKAMAEKWDTLPHGAGEIRYYDEADRRKNRMDLIESGLATPDELDALEKEGKLNAENVAHLKVQAKLAAQQKPEKNLTPDSARHLAELDAKALLERQARISPQGKLAYLQERYANGDPKQTQFSKEQWDEAHQYGMQPNEYDMQRANMAAYLGLTPSMIGALNDEDKTNKSIETPGTPEAPKGRDINAHSIVAPNGKVYHFKTPEEMSAFKKKAGL